MKTAHQLVMPIPVKENTDLYHAMKTLKDFKPLLTEVPVYKGGKQKKGKAYDLDAYEFLCKAIYDQCTDEELKTLHNNDSIVNEVIKALTSETTHYLDNITKNIINRRLFTRAPPRELKEETLELKPKDFGKEFREFQRLCKEGVIINDLEYTSKSGKTVTIKRALADKDYEKDCGMSWFLVNEEEEKYFNEHGYFPLRCDTSNGKLGEKWMYLSFELAWLCSGDAHGGCQCPKYCYGRHMESMYKNVRDRIMKFMNAWEHHTFEEKVEFYTAEIMNDRNGIRFCDTGDMTNQKLLDEIFEVVVEVSKNLREQDIDPIGRFYIYSTRADLDWSNKPWELVLNASNRELFEKVPDANWFRVVISFDEIPKILEAEGSKVDENTLHICNCNCKACDYCSICRNQMIWEILG